MVGPLLVDGILMAGPLVVDGILMAGPLSLKHQGQEEGGAWFVAQTTAHS